MTRFFVRLAIAALADWFTWQISTPEMRFERVRQKHLRRLVRTMKAATAAVEEFGVAVRGIAQGFVRLADEWQNI